MIVSSPVMGLASAHLVHASVCALAFLVLVVIFALCLRASSRTSGAALAALMIVGVLSLLVAGAAAVGTVYSLVAAMMLSS